MDRDTKRKKRKKYTVPVSSKQKKKHNLTFKKKRQPRKTLFKKDKTSPRKKTPSPPKNTKKKLKEKFLFKMEKIFKGNIKELSSQPKG